MRTLLIIAIILFAPELCGAQSKKIPVVVSHFGKDRVGESFAFALKEAIRASQSFYLDESDSNKPAMHVHLTTMGIPWRDSSFDWSGNVSAISDAIAYDSLQVDGSGIFMSNGVHVCGRERIDFCAKSLLPRLDGNAQRLRKFWPHLWNNLQAER
jgi:hypothetical protein